MWLIFFFFVFLKKLVDQESHAHQFLIRSVSTGHCLSLLPDPDTGKLQTLMCVPHSRPHPTSFFRVVLKVGLGEWLCCFAKSCRAVVCITRWKKSLVCLDSARWSIERYQREVPPLGNVLVGDNQPGLHAGILSSTIHLPS